VTICISYFRILRSIQHKNVRHTVTWTKLKSPSNIIWFVLYCIVIHFHFRRFCKRHFSINSHSNTIICDRCKLYCSIIVYYCIQYTYIININLQSVYWQFWFFMMVILWLVYIVYTFLKKRLFNKITTNISVCNKNNVLLSAYFICGIDNIFIFCFISVIHLFLMGLWYGSAADDFAEYLKLLLIMYPYKSIYSVLTEQSTKYIILLNNIRYIKNISMKYWTVWNSVPYQSYISGVPIHYDIWYNFLGMLVF